MCDYYKRVAFSYFYGVGDGRDIELDMERRNK